MSRYAWTCFAAPTPWMMMLTRLYTSQVIMDTTKPLIILKGPTQMMAKVQMLLTKGLMAAPAAMMFSRGIKLE